MTRTVAPPPTPTNVAVRKWLNMTEDHLRAIVRSTDAIASAAKSQDLRGVGAACSQFHDAVNGLQGHMPTPDPQLTTALQSALSDYDTGTHFCMAGTQDFNLDEVKHSTTFIESANNYMQQVTDILDRDLGTSGNVFG